VVGCGSLAPFFGPRLSAVICGMPQGTNSRVNGWRGCSLFKAWFVLVSILFSLVVQAQEPTGLSHAESRMLASLVERFQPLPSIERIWTGAFVAAAEKTAAIKAKVDSVERSGMEETEVLVTVGALRQDLRVIKQDRNVFVAGFLSPWDQLALDSILSPPAPSIQHFGFHDRLKCLVCKKPGEGAIFPSGINRPDQLLLPKD